MWNVKLKFQETPAPAGRPLLAGTASVMRNGSLFTMERTRETLEDDSSFYDGFAEAVRLWLKGLGLRLTFHEIRSAMGDKPTGDALATVLRGSNVRFMKEKGVKAI